MQRMHPDSVGPDGDGNLIQPRRRQACPAHRAGARGHLPRQDHQLGRARDRKAEQGRETAQPQDHARLPQRRIRRHVCLHGLPVPHQPHVEGEVGNATSVSFPTGVGGKGNAGVTAVVSSTPGAIAYISASYIIAQGLQAAELQNAAGNYEYPNLKNIEAAAAVVKKVPANNEMHIVDPPKTDKLAYPLSTFTYCIVPKGAPQAAALASWIYYAMTIGQSFGATLDFAPIPKVVLAAGFKSVKELKASKRHERSTRRKAPTYSCAAHRRPAKGGGAAATVGTISQEALWSLSGDSQRVRASWDIATDPRSTNDGRDQSCFPADSPSPSPSAPRPSRSGAVPTASSAQPPAPAQAPQQRPQPAPPQ